jgi:hypothetical protein
MKLHYILVFLFWIMKPISTIPKKCLCSIIVSNNSFSGGSTNDKTYYTQFYLTNFYSDSTFQSGIYFTSFEEKINFNKWNNNRHSLWFKYDSEQNIYKLDSDSNYVLMYPMSMHQEGTIFNAIYKAQVLDIYSRDTVVFQNKFTNPSKIYVEQLKDSILILSTQINILDSEKDSSIIINKTTLFSPFYSLNRMLDFNYLWTFEDDKNIGNTKKITVVYISPNCNNFLKKKLNKWAPINGIKVTNSLSNQQKAQIEKIISSSY